MMGIRTDTTLVKGVLGKDYDESASGNRPLHPYIDAASIVVDKIAREPNRGDNRELEMIERWLSACFYCMSDKPFQSHSSQGSSASYMGRSDKGWDSNPYGQNAKRIDSSGYLWRTDIHAQADLGWLGKTENEQLTYEDRN